MLNEKIQMALNKQMNSEIYSWYLYLAVSAHFDHVNFNGFARWMKLQADEEMTHAMKLFGYLNQVNAKIALDNIAAPQIKWGSPLDIFQQILDHELKITESINQIADLCISERDHATNNFLIWFVNEQVEEIATAEMIVEKLKFIGDSHNGIFFLDHELGKRT
ncbi:MAG: ferritin [Ignavibacteriales bacterium]